MAVLYSTEPVPYGLPAEIVGYHLDENLTGEGEIEVRELINLDYASVIGTTSLNFFLSAKFAPICFINSYSNEFIKTFSGNPPRGKFGQLNIRHLNLYEQEQFITVEKQVFPNRECIVNPEVLPFPPDMSALPETITFEGISRSRPYSVRTFLNLDGGYLLADAISYRLEQSVNANIGFFYFAYLNAVSELSLGSSLFVGI